MGVALALVGLEFFGCFAGGGWVSNPSSSIAAAMTIDELFSQISVVILLELLPFCRELFYCNRSGVHSVIRARAFSNPLQYAHAVSHRYDGVG